MFNTISIYPSVISFSRPTTTRNDNLEQQAQALYKSWFVNFEPFKDGKFMDSELGMIPESWRVISFASFIIHSSEKTENIIVPEYSVTNEGIFPRAEKYNKQLSSSSTKNKIVRKGDLVFGMSREILNWGIMADAIGGVSSAYTVYNCIYNGFDQEYLRNYLNNHIDYFKDLIKPAAREGQGIDKAMLMNKSIIIPSNKVIASFNAKYYSLMEQIDNYRQQICILSNQRDVILPKLMSGKIKINELDC